MSLPEEHEIRQRKRPGLNEFVREFDSFNKVVDDVKEEPTIANGLYTVICFVIIFVLSVGQIKEYLMEDDVLYKFSVDTAYDERPTVSFDLMVATPCNALSVFAVSQASGSNENENVVKEPSRFEMNDRERALWERLRTAQREQFQPGTRFKALNDMSYVSGHVEEALQSIADDKVAAEADDIEKKRRENPPNENHQNHGGHVVMLIGNGQGMFQLISVLKGDGDKLIISPTNVINMPEFFGVAELNAGATTNFSHRIERFHFGSHIRGLVTPLAGTDKTSESGRTMYKYYIKIVPTRIHNRFGGSTLTYQYAVTSMQRDMHESGFVSSGIAFSYEFVAYVVEVWPKQISFVQFVLRLCCVIGGVFATSVSIHTLSASLHEHLRHESPASPAQVLTTGCAFRSSGSAFRKEPSVLST
ncbi:hypothetical protein M3Y99_00305200 [Aphelenchoides fujianensis]|nr:hypothetical protein M3Y99_00305200 [Aphelenchoides fujianensis]